MRKHHVRGLGKIVGYGRDVSSAVLAGEFLLLQIFFKRTYCVQGDALSSFGHGQLFPEVF